MKYGENLICRFLLTGLTAIALLMQATAQTNNIKITTPGGSPYPGLAGIFYQDGTYGNRNLPLYKHVSGGFFIYYDLYQGGDESWDIDTDQDDDGNNVLFYWNAFNNYTTSPTCPITGVTAGNQWNGNGANGEAYSIPTSAQLAIASMTFTNGSSYFPPKVVQSSNNNIVGRFQLIGSSEGGVLQALTISLAGTRTGITAVKLWKSTDATFSSGSDTQLSSKTDATSITFNGFNTIIDHSSGNYFFITVDVGSSTGSVTPTIPSQASFTFAGASQPSSFTNAALSSAAVYLQNTTPTSSNNTVTGTEDNDKTFATSDFPYTDADGDALTNVKVTTLESAGSLYLDSDNDGVIDGGEDITANQVITAANVSKLKLKPAANGNGNPYATFQFQVGDASVYSSSSYTMTVNVTGVNDTPTLSSVSTLTSASEDVAYTITYAALAAAANEADIDGDAISFRLEAVSTGTLTKNAVAVTPGSTLLSTGESWVWTTASNANGTLNAFTVKAYDGTTASSSAVQVQISVAAVNDAPTLTSVSTLTSGTEDVAYTVTYTALSTAANEADTEGDAISFRVEVVSTGTLTKNAVAVTPGTTLLSTGESWVWTPAAGANGTLNAFTIKSWDGAAASASAVQVQVTVSSVNDAPTVTTDAASSITSTGATLNGTVNADNQSTTVTFQYGPTVSYGTSVTADQSPVTGTSNTSVSKAVTGLTPNSTYHYRVVGVNATGTTNGSDLTFTTSAALPTATTNAATDVTETSATLNGSVNAQNSSTVVRFLYGTVTGTYPDSVLAAQSPVGGTSSTPVSAGLTGLTGSVTYYVRVSASNSAGYVLGSEQSFTTDAPLPVELVSFIAKSNRLKTELQWKTAAEVNNYGFEVERKMVQVSEPRPETGEWVRAGFVEGSGTVNVPREYTFFDRNITSGKWMYRLKQFDHDGKFKYSQEIEVEVGTALKVFELSQNYPNPFNPSTTFEFTLPEDGFVTFKVYDMLGREAATLVNQELTSGVIHLAVFDAASLSSGMYFARLQLKDKVSVKRLLLVK